MERKRRLPPRAAARQEQAAKRRNVTPRGRSSTPAVVEPPPREPTPPPPPPTPPPPLPKSIEVGKPLPTVEEPQAADLSSKEYQSLTESGVLSESLSRSRHRWISEGLFEKFWAKPHKRKGVLQEDPNNPPKDSMMKVGVVTITIEPHIVEATMYAVKTSKLLPHQQQKFHHLSRPQPPKQASDQVQPTQPTQSPAQGQIRQQQQQASTQSQVGTQSQPQVQPTTQPQQATPALARPVLQYGPPNGAMPPPSTQSTTNATSTPMPPTTAGASTTVGATRSPSVASSGTATTTVPAVPHPANAPSTSSPVPTNATPTLSFASAPATAGPAVKPADSRDSAPAPVPAINPQPSPMPTATPQPPGQLQQIQSRQKASSGVSPKPVQQAQAPASTGQPPPGSTGVSAPPRASPTHAPVQPPTAPQHIARPSSNPSMRQAAAPAPAPAPALAGPSGQPAAPRPVNAQNQSASPAPSKPATAAKSAANDPVIALLAQKASKDPDLRDLMKRVAVGEAKDGELAKFQKIIDQLNAEYRQKGGQQGPSADRLLVGGRTVKYFADEVRTILDIVLASNPNQKSSELRPPPRSDPLVVLLVKTALEDQRTRDMIRRIAEGKPGFTDATDLKQILDRLHRDAKITPTVPSPGPSQVRAPATNGPSPSIPAKAHAPHATQQSNPPVLKSKGPPSANRPDISAVVFDFGSGDRYLFPQYSILEFLPSRSGQQVVASFLIIRKGSVSEYGGDPKLDYYQPVTIRLQTTVGRHLENLARVVAPQDDVRWYMDDVMDNMTRAEYVLLAMRLPRADFDPEESVPAVEDSKASSPSPKSEPETDQTSTPKPGVLWSTGPSTKTPDPSLSVKLQDPEQEAQSKYERLIRSVAEKEVDGVA
ncbi:hypothetical protein QQS21_011469 [Conoideocrella luteorostrata]|uniref:SWR1-complex protein 3 domain-containing protein n=1 Tax=Conoideocrella luteorostrata TaxID=1105319 RepID=A0AAJ0FNI8_9HYPO|nr:hypothetical protein QQS21_011469 [Conoideocrella luteorostrata]